MRPSRRLCGRSSFAGGRAPGDGVRTLRSDEPLREQQYAPMQDLAGKHIVLGLTGGIACYKSAELCRLLVKAGASVQVVMTEAATQFMTPVTMQAAVS